jgi:hypothetical protein
MRETNTAPRGRAAGEVTAAGPANAPANARGPEDVIVAPAEQLR